MANFFQRIQHFLLSRFSLQEDKADEQEIITSIRKNVEFSGVNLWALIFAIFIASIGLNVNSTAVIIGAMLISPIMGPVTGIGLGVGINDLSLVRKGAKNLLIATIISIITSYLYFKITPLHDVQSELLARTSPSIWDVFIAFFGGLAGMVAASRKEKSNVVPGVAIATALMPPLCTVGFGLAMGNWFFVVGALYLYFINSVFIAIATYLMSRYLKMERRHFDEPADEKKVTRYIIIIVIITIAPSIYMAYRIVDKSIFEHNASRFVEEQFNFDNTQVVSKVYRYKPEDRHIEVLLIGNVLSKKRIDSVTQNLTDYKLGQTKLTVRQGLDARQQVDLSQIKASILEEVFAAKGMPDTAVAAAAPADTLTDQQVLSELKTLYPSVRSFGMARINIYQPDSAKAQPAHVAIAGFSTILNSADKQKIQTWLRLRYKRPNISLVANTVAGK